MGAFCDKHRYSGTPHWAGVKLPYYMPDPLPTPSTAVDESDGDDVGDEEPMGDRFTYGAATRGDGDEETIIDFTGYGTVVKTKTRFGSYLKQRHATLGPLFWKIRTAFRQPKYANTPLKALAHVTRKQVAWAHGTVWTRGCYYPHAGCKS